MKKDPLEDWLDGQEEQAEKERLTALLDEATAAGVNVPGVIKAAGDGYRYLKAEGATFHLIEEGILNEDHFLIKALRGAIESATKKRAER